jgi:multiple antibiotic resistance protein
MSAGGIGGNTPDGESPEEGLNLSKMSMRQWKRTTPRAGGRLIPLLLWLEGAAVLLAQTPANMPGPSSEHGGELSLSMTFTAFFVMLGPIKLVGPFARLTSDLQEAEARRIAARATGFACAGGLVAAVFGQNMLISWGISLPALHFAGGIVLLLVALRTVLAQYEPVSEPTQIASARNIALAPLAFPTILTPHGIAIFILILAVTRDGSRDGAIIALFVVVMALNWLVMLFARPIMRRGGVFLAILGSVLGVLQVALGIQMMITAMRSLHILPT